MNAVNTLLTDIADLLLAPFARWPLAALLVSSVAAGILATVVFKRTSNPLALRGVADRTKAALLCLRLFKDDLRAALRAQAELLGATGLRLVHSLPPMLVLLVPFMLLLIQLALRFEHRPLQPGEATVVELHLAEDAWPKWRDVQLQAPDGVRIETPALRDDIEHIIYWRLRLLQSPSDPIRWAADGFTVEKTLVGGHDSTRLCAVSATRAGADFWQRVLHPGETAFDAGSPAKRVVLNYPRRAVPILGTNAPWWATFLVTSLLTSVLTRPFLRVQF